MPHPFAKEDLTVAFQDGVRKLNELCHIAYFSDTILSEAELMMAYIASVTNRMPKPIQADNTQVASLGEAAAVPRHPRT